MSCNTFGYLCKFYLALQIYILRMFEADIEFGGAQQVSILLQNKGNTKKLRIPLWKTPRSLCLKEKPQSVTEKTAQSTSEVSSWRKFLVHSGLLCMIKIEKREKPSVIINSNKSFFIQNKHLTFVPATWKDLRLIATTWKKR